MASIEKRGDYSYRITVSAGYDSAGKKIRAKKTISVDPSLTPKQLEKELRRQEALFEKEVENGTYLDGSQITLSEFYQRWLKDYARKNLAKTTIAHRKELFEKRIIPALGHIKLSKLQPNHLIQFYNNLEEGGIRLDYKRIAKDEFVELSKNYSIAEIARLSGVQPETISKIIKKKTPCMANTAKKICLGLGINIDKYFDVKDKDKQLSSARILDHHKAISSLLSTAVHWQLITSNPAERVKPPKLERKEAKAYDEDQTEALLSAVEYEPIKYKLALHIVVFTGCRLGELSGIEWKDLDWENNTLEIHRASNYTSESGIYTDTTKSISGERIISVPKSLIRLFKKHWVCQQRERIKLGDQWEEHDRVFTKWNGSPIFPSTPSKWFKRIQLRHGLPELKFHELRHTNASLLIAQGVNIRTVSKRLGHARTSITTDIYAHALRRPDKEAAEKLDALLGKKRAKNNHA